MHRNPIWIAFFSLVILVTLFFIFKAGSALYSYSKFSSQAEAEVISTEVVARKGQKYVVWAHFRFSDGKEMVEGVGVVGKPYMNRFTAEKKAQSLPKTISIWYHPKTPKEALLEKHFPYKETISALVLLSLSLYFFTLGRYVRRKHYSD